MDIDIRYFFVKDRVDKNEFKIEYCPTESMLADFFTKPLQGGLYKKFRDVLMGYKHITTLFMNSVDEIKERVEHPSSKIVIPSTNSPEQHVKKVAFQTPLSLTLTSTERASEPVKQTYAQVVKNNPCMSNGVEHTFAH